MSSTAAERRTLALVAAIAVLGVVARIVRARESRPVPTAAEVAALDAQIARVESARAAARGGGGSRGRRSPSRGSEAVPIRPAREAPVPPPRVDVDVADAAALEALPWVGPALAARIVESRERCGPFGSLEALTRVYGIGPAMARRLEPHVTFSTPSRPIGAGQAPGCQGSAKSAASRRRGRS